MKKILTVIVLLISSTVYSQKFQFGAKAGVNISNFTGGDFEAVKKKALVGFHGGDLSQVFYCELLYPA